MNIRFLMQKMQSAKNEEESKNVENEIIRMFSLLSDEEKDAVRKEFMKGLNETVNDGKKLIHRIDAYLEMTSIKKIA